MLHSDVCSGLFFGDGRSPSRDDLPATLQSIRALPVDVVTPDDIADAAASLTLSRIRVIDNHMHHMYAMGHGAGGESRKLI